METRSGGTATGPSPVQKNRLGRGLASLIGEAAPGAPRLLPAEGSSKVVPIERVRPSPLNPRKNFEQTDAQSYAVLEVNRGKTFVEAYGFERGEHPSHSLLTYAAVSRAVRIPFAAEFFRG